MVLGEFRVLGCRCCYGFGEMCLVVFGSSGFV